MKKWIIGQYISLAEVFGWRVPNWMHRQLPPAEMRALLDREADLSQALKKDELSDVQVPGNLEFLIESRIKASANVTKPRPSVVSILVPVVAFAACAMLGLYLINTPDWVEPAKQDSVAESIPEIGNPIQTVTSMAGLNTSEKGDPILRPLSSEKARLSSDVTNALKYVAQGVVPDQYLDQVNFRLDAFNAEMSKPI